MFDQVKDLNSEVFGIDEACNALRLQAEEIGRDVNSFCNNQTSWNFQEAYKKKDELHAYTLRQENDMSEMEKERQNFGRVSKNITTIKQEATQLKQSRQETNRNVEASNERLRHEMAQMSGCEADRKIKELEHQLGKLGNILGLDIIRSTHGSLILTFSNLDRVNPDKLCTLEIKVVNRVWELVHSNPTIVNMDELMRTLNETNNLSGFVSSVRRIFAKLVKQEA
eukprot:TRINITY_DN2162_c0_g1_i2.p1 TRINITY_DN2162_c0_g1~~TRINITY_DN2162_c0_g1_i2.p1  ORF type:complete len:225 (-),score=51.16 TRINITY_DN2162_c0_g1_i2:473-1147(-)